MKDMMSDPHPRPQLERAGWISLNGEWDFSLDEVGSKRDAEDVV